MRMTCALPASPRTSAGIGRCFTRSQTFSKHHGAFRYPAEKRPPTFAWKTTMLVHEHEREEEARDTEPERPEEREDVITNRYWRTAEKIPMGNVSARRRGSRERSRPS
jgi:hypothetical protein